MESEVEVEINTEKEHQTKNLKRGVEGSESLNTRKEQNITNKEGKIVEPERSQNIQDRSKEGMVNEEEETGE